jgi:hypothetical protein
MVWSNLYVFRKYPATVRPILQSFYAAQPHDPARAARFHYNFALLPGADPTKDSK